MKWLSLLLLLLQPAPLTAQWQPTGLRVVWSAPEPGCLYLTGNLPEQLLDVPCAAAGDVLLATGGVDQAYAPQLRTRVELRAQSDLTRVLASVDIPARYEVTLPIVVT